METEGIISLSLAALIVSIRIYKTWEKQTVGETIGLILGSIAAIGILGGLFFMPLITLFSYYILGEDLKAGESINSVWIIVLILGFGILLSISKTRKIILKILVIIFIPINLVWELIQLLVWPIIIIILLLIIFNFFFDIWIWSEINSIWNESFK